MNFMDLNIDTGRYTWTSLAWAKNVWYISDTGQRHNLPDRNIDACTDWHRRTYTENYRICIMATPFSSAAVLFCTHRSTVIWTQPLDRKGIYVITTTSGKVIIRIHETKNLKSYSTSETRSFLKSSAWIAFIGLYVTWLAKNEVLEIRITITLIKHKYVYKITLIKKLKADYIRKCY